MDFVKLLALCLLGAVISILLKSLAPSFSTLLAVFVSLSVAGVCIYCIIPFVEFFYEMTEGTGFSAYVQVLFKVCGIAMLTRFAGEICKDAGEAVYASKAYMAGKTAILLSALPVIKALFEQVKDLMS